MKLIRIITISFCIIILLSQNIFAISDILDKGKNWEDVGIDNADMTMDTEMLIEVEEQLYNILLAGATIVAVIVGAIIAIQMMTSGISKKAEAKEALVPYVISCIVVFGGLGIWKLVVLLLSNF